MKDDDFKLLRGFDYRRTDEQTFVIVESLSWLKIPLFNGALNVPQHQQTQMNEWSSRKYMSTNSATNLGNQAGQAYNQWNLQITTAAKSLGMSIEYLPVLVSTEQLVIEPDGKHHWTQLHLMPQNYSAFLEFCHL